MILLLLFSLQLTAASGVQLIERFECGSDSARGSAEVAWNQIKSCNYAVRNETNLCCMEHDVCYELHQRTNYTQDHCDLRFCMCLEDVIDRTNNDECKYTLFSFCGGTRVFGLTAFESSVPNATFHESRYAGFEDAQPLGLDMQRLVDACVHAKGIAVYCHNSVYKCLQEDHERFKRLDVVEHSYQDCRSTMHDCMQVIIETEPNSTCSTVARDIAKQANTYMELDECEHGRSIIETYPIVAARLIKQCNESQIALCLLDFHDCAESQENRSDRPEVFSVVRKIKVGCHHELRTCIGLATERETSEDCIEARNLAIGRIRDTHLEPVKRSIRANRAYLASIDGRRR